MQRCLQLAVKGLGAVAPNPLVGAVLVYNGRIIGEGWHQQYGKAHAEVNCLNNVSIKNKHLINQSTLYINLEPCAHYGKTPPCTELIIQNKISKVVIGCLDPFEKVNGRGIEILNQTGIEVIIDVLRDQCIELNKRFFTFYIKKRPYIILKWAQTNERFIAKENHSTKSERLLISNDYSNRLVHKWRSEESAIMVGKNTALYDNPQLTTRWWKGKSPTRLVIDSNLQLPSHLHLFDKTVKTIVFNFIKQQALENLIYYRLVKEEPVLKQVLNILFQLNIQSVIVEGGAKLLQSFIDENIFDEIRIIENTSIHLQSGLKAPNIQNSFLDKTDTLNKDNIFYYKNINNDILSW